MAKKKSASVQRGQVKLREKKLKDGSSSLYLDINVGGKRHKEYLKLYPKSVVRLNIPHF